jgi:hypothetical protein
LLLSNDQISEPVDFRPGIYLADVELGEGISFIEVYGVAEEPFLEDLSGGRTEFLGLVCLQQFGVFLTVLVVFVFPEPEVFSFGVAGL